MAKNKNGNKLWIAGAVLGAVAGAAYALWKTPMSGEELRGKLASGPVAQRDDISTNTTHTPGAADKLLRKVEQTLAPIVGVELGKTANKNGSADSVTPEPVATPPAEPKMPEAPFGAADTKPESEPAVQAVGGNTDHGAETIRAKRFAWGSPTPEAGVQPVPVNPAAGEVVPEPAPEPEVAKEPVAAGATSEYGSQSIRSKNFAWGDPAPNASAATSASEPSAETTNASTQETRSVEAVADASPASGSRQRKFPTLGGLE